MGCCSSNSGDRPQVAVGKTAAQCQALSPLVAEKRAPDLSSPEPGNLADEAHEHGGLCEAATVGSDAAADAALRACRARLELGDIPGAEAALMAELEGAGPSTVAIIRASPEYAETLRGVHGMEQVASEVYGNGIAAAGAGSRGWTKGCEVKVDYAGLGMPIDEVTAKALPAESKFTMWYLIQGKKLNIKGEGMIPTRCGDMLPNLAGFVAMYLETDLWNEWHPIIIGNGPIEKWPKRPYHNLWQVPLKFLMQSQMEMVEQRFHFQSDRGLLLLSMEGKPPGHKLWETYPAPKGYKVLPGYNQTRVAVATGELLTYFTTVVTIHGDFAIPEFVVKLLMTWILPEIIRRQLRAGAACLKAGGPHAVKMQQDVDGVYAECVRLAAGGGTLAEVGPGSPPTAELMLGRPRNLATFERDYQDGHRGSASNPAVLELESTHVEAAFAHSGAVGERAGQSDDQPIDESLPQIDYTSAPACGCFCTSPGRAQEAF